MKTPHTQTPRVINVDKNAAYPPSVDDLKAEKHLSEDTELRPVKYLNNRVEQDHRWIKRLARDLAPSTRLDPRSKGMKRWP